MRTIVLRLMFQTVVALILLFWSGSIDTTIAAPNRPVTTLTEKQIADHEKIYFNCGHGGRLGCLIASCRARTFSKGAAATIQFLYVDASKDFPELITKQLSACFAKAGGRFE